MVRIYRLISETFGEIFTQICMKFLCALVSRPFQVGWFFRFLFQVLQSLTPTCSVTESNYSTGYSKFSLESVSECPWCDVWTDGQE